MTGVFWSGARPLGRRMSACRRAPPSCDSKYAWLQSEPGGGAAAKADGTAAQSSAAVNRTTRTIIRSKHPCLDNEATQGTGRLRSARRLLRVDQAVQEPARLRDQPLGRIAVRLGEQQ